MRKKNQRYGIQVKWYGLSGIGIYNENKFEINDLDIWILQEQKSRSCHLNTIAACSEWRENLQENDGESNPGNKRGKFCSFGYFEGVPQRIDTELFHEDTGIYEGNPHDALVWPDTDPDEKWQKELVFRIEEVSVQVKIRLIARGPKMAFCGHSFTGLWDSSYYFIISGNLQKWVAGMQDLPIVIGAELGLLIMLGW